MSVKGEKFLKLSQAEAFVITAHALERIRQYTGHWLESAEAYQLFKEAQHLTPQQLILLGYQPAYGRRKNRGENSWYFRFTLRGKELIAVIAEKKDSGRYAWVTTYGRNLQTDLFRMPLSGCDYPARAADRRSTVAA